jgi:uncharacterized protein YgbK (DUF1537 family)
VAAGARCAHRRQHDHGALDARHEERLGDAAAVRAVGDGVVVVGRGLAAALAGARLKQRQAEEERGQASRRRSRRSARSCGSSL